MDSKNRLRQILEKMDVPLGRLALSLQDIRWLGRNIGVRNSQHPDFREAVNLLSELAPDALHVWK